MYTLTFWLWLFAIGLMGWLLVFFASLGVNEVAEMIARMVEPYV